MVAKSQKYDRRESRAKSRDKSKVKSLEVRIGRLRLKNPVIAASGTFGYGEEMSGYFDINKLGAIITKTITLNPIEGNPTPRIVETASGMLNSIGLENKGLKDFIINKAPFLEKLKTNVIVSISGFSSDEFLKLTEGVSGLKCVSAIELNLSCPNISGTRHKAQGTRMISQDRTKIRKLVSAVRRRTKLTLISKLSPNITDIKEIAKACEDAGSDAISLINTIFGVSIDIKTKKSNLGMAYGGLSGPAIKPIALNFVREARSAVRIPIVGIGGIMTASDALEFIICGASAIQAGTANFINPTATIEILDGIIGYMRERKIRNISHLVGSLEK